MKDADVAADADATMVADVVTDVDATMESLVVETAVYGSY